MTVLFRLFRYLWAKVRRQYRPSYAVLGFNQDGLEIARVRKKRRYLPLFHLTMFVYLGLIIRLVVMANVGPASYANRIENLSNGNMLERAGAVVMYMDPVSRDIAIKLRSAIRDWESA